MEEHEQGLQYVESILDKEQEELSQSKRQHHTDWDNHILTLSTASLGFTFSFLPITSDCYFSLLLIGIFSFILAICFATANYIIADIGFNFAFDSLVKKRVFNTKLKQAFFLLNKSVAKAEETKDKEAYDLANKKYDDEVSQLFEDVDFDGEISEKDKINKKILILNHAKTYAFISGVLFVVIFSLLNINEFAK